MQNETKLNYDKHININEETGEILETSAEEILMENKELVEKQISGYADIYANSSVVENALQENKQLGEVIKKALIDGTDYGIIEGTGSISLFQSGADKLARVFKVKIEYEQLKKEMNLQDKLEKYISFEYKALAFWQDKLIGSAIADANTMEQKFRSHFQKFNKTSQEWEPKPAKSVFDIQNVVNQMSQKRAGVRVVRKIFGISGLFTQDIEQMPDDRAPKDERMSIYSLLYQFALPWMGKNKEERRNWLKINILNKICKNLTENRRMQKWTNDDIIALNELLNKDETIIEMINNIKENNQNAKSTENNQKS